MRYLSLFSGIEAVTVAWASLGFEAVAFAEIEAFPCAVLKAHYPDVPNLGDVTKITETVIRQQGPIDLVVFGSPCQDLSIAGKGKGLKGERSSLFYDAVRIITWARRHCGCRFALWENVPGAFTSNQGADFSEVLRLLTGTRQHQPEKWRNAGVAFGQQGLVEWRVLDAQYFGVPQRRRRIFAFADFGDWRGRKPVLFEPGGLRRHPAKGKKKKQDLAGTLEARTRAGGFPGTDGACANHVIPVKTKTVFGGYSGPVKLSPALETTCHDYSRADGFVTVIEPTGFSAWANGERDEVTDGTPPVRCSNRVAAVIPVHDQATRHLGKRGAKQDGKGNGLGIGQPGDPMNTLTAGDKHAVAYCRTTNDALRDAAEDLAPTLRAGNSGGAVTPAVAFAENSRNEVRLENGDGAVTGALTTGGGKAGQGHPAILNSMAIRRLTPLECERLQGFEDNWTRIPWRNKDKLGCPDGLRYKAIGNSMAVPVVRWIGQRIKTVCGD